MKPTSCLLKYIYIFHSDLEGQVLLSVMPDRGTPKKASPSARVHPPPALSFPVTI